MTPQLETKLNNKVDQVDFDIEMRNKANKMD